MKKSRELLSQIILLSLMLKKWQEKHGDVIQGQFWNTYEPRLDIRLRVGNNGGGQQQYVAGRGL